MIEIIDRYGGIEENAAVFGTDGKVIGYTWRYKKDNGHMENFDDGTGVPVMFWKHPDRRR